MVSGRFLHLVLAVSNMLLIIEGVKTQTIFKLNLLKEVMKKKKQYVHNMT